MSTLTDQDISPGMYVIVDPKGGFPWDGVVARVMEHDGSYWCIEPVTPSPYKLGRFTAKSLLPFITVSIGSTYMVQWSDGDSDNSDGGPWQRQIDLG